MSLKIRKAELEDYDVLCRLFAQIDELHQQWYPDIFRNSEGLIRTRHEIGELIMPRHSQVFLAELNGEGIGMALIRIENTPDFRLLKKMTYLFLETIVVDKKHRRKGVGTALFNAIKKFAEEKNISRIELKVYFRNEDAILFCKKFGFADYWKRMSLSSFNDEK